MRGRAGIFYLAGLVIGLIVFVTVTPLVVPVERVRSGVARALSSYAGVRLTLDGPAAVRLFPAPEVEFRDVVATAETGRRVIAADRVRVSVDLIQLVLGRAPVATVDLIRPDLRLSASALPDLLLRDRLARVQPMALRIEDGRATVVDDADREIDRLERIAADFAWERPTARLRLGASFVRRGQTVAVTLQGIGPRALAQGETGNLSLNLTTPAGRLALAGQVMAVDRLMIEGALSISASRPLALARWLAGAPAATFDLGEGTLDGRLKLVGNSATLTGANITLGSAKGEGILSAQWDGGRPLLRGTVDFDAVTVSAADAGWLAPTAVELLAAPELLRRTDLDLRLSTERLRAETVDFTQVGVTVVVKDGQVVCQIAEAQIAGGDMSARLVAQPAGTAARLAIDISADRVEVGRLAALLGRSEPKAGVLTGEVRLEALAAPAPTQITALSGRAQARVKAMRFSVTPDWLLPTADAGRGGSLAFDTVATEATLAGTLATIGRLTADGPGPGLTLAGTVDLAKGTLSLAGVRSLPGPARQSAVSALRLGGALTRPTAVVGVP
jgi:hypothetical protein